MQTQMLPSHIHVTSQAWPITFICTACELRMDLTFSNGWGKNSKGEYFMACENHVKFEFQHP